MGARNISHVIFDMDGVLLNTEVLYTKVLSKYCESFEKTFTWEVKEKQMGRKPEESAKVLLDALSIPDSVEQYLTKTNEMLYEIFPECEQMDGAHRLVQHLSENGIPLAVATGSSEKDFILKTKNHASLFKYFSHVVKSGSDPEVQNGKPAPDIFLIAAKRFSKPPSDLSKCLVIEDAPNGVQAALDAGMKVVWMPDPCSEAQNFRGNPNVDIIRSLDAFVPERYGLPGYT